MEMVNRPTTVRVGQCVKWRAVTLDTILREICVWGGMEMLESLEVVIYQTDMDSSTGMDRIGEVVKLPVVYMDTTFQGMSAGIRECIHNKKAFRGFFWCWGNFF